MTLTSTLSAPAASCGGLWYTRCPVPTTSGIAVQRRWLHAAFAQRGTAFDSLRASDDVAIRAAHYDHGHENLLREGGNVPPIWARSNGADTRVVGITWVDERQVLLVRGDSALRGPADLRGARLGVPRLRTRLVDIAATAHLRGLLSGLQIAGVRPDEAQFVDIASGGDPDLKEQVPEGKGDNAGRPELLAALLEGRVDVIYAKGASAVLLAERHGLRAVVDIGAQEEPLLRVNAGTPRPVTVNRDLVERDPESVALYLAVLLKTADWARTHADEATASIAAETGVPAERVRQGYAQDFHLQLAPSLSPLYVQGLRAQKAFLHDHGFLVKDFDVDDWIDPRPLARALELLPEVTLEDPPAV